MSRRGQKIIRIGEGGRVLRAPRQLQHSPKSISHVFNIQNLVNSGDPILPKVSPMTDETKQKIRELSQADVPIGERRALYNQLGRRMKHSGLKAGLVQKYTACLGNSKERFQLLKEFLIDENLLDTEVVSAWMFGFILLTPLKERL